MGTRILDLLQLQNLTKRDPSAYKEEFLLQYQHYLTQLQIFQLKPTKDFKHFANLVSYLSHVCICYPKELAEFPKQISDLLEHNCNSLEPDLRRILAKSLILMRNRNLLPQINLLSLFFKLFRIHDKPLRSLLYSHIVADIKNTNLKQKNQKLNRTLQNFMFTMMNDDSEIASKMSLKVMIELFRKKIWHDTKTVNVISNGVFSKNAKILVTTLKFFLHVDNPDKKDDDEEEQATKEQKAKDKMRKMSLSMRVGKKTKGRKTRLVKSKTDLKKAKAEEESKTLPNFPAIELIHDPQGYCDKLFNVLQKTTVKFETRVLIMNFISRLIFTHKLIVYNFYPFLQKYLQPHQKNITYVLAVLAQSCHDLVEPDVLKPLVMTIAKYFVNDGCSPEVIAIGLNTIRNIVSRCPLAMEPVLLQDLIHYKDKKEKGVAMASKSLLQFFRDNYPSMLPRKERGKNKKDVLPLAFGSQKVSQGVDGIELLYDEELNRQLEAYENGELDDELDSDEEGWEEVEGEEDDENDESMVSTASGIEGESDDDEEDEEDEGEWETDDEEVEGEEEGEEWKSVEGQEVEEDSDDQEDGDEDGDEDGEWETDDEEQEDDEDDEEFEDVEQDEEEEEEEEEVVPKLVQKKKPVKDNDEMDIKILTDEDLLKIQKLKLLKQSLEENKKNIDLEEGMEEDDYNQGIINPEDLMGSHKKARATLEERIASIKEGREGRLDYKSKAYIKKLGKSMTNEEKAKKSKPYMLMKQSLAVRSKMFESFRTKQMKKRAHAVKSKKFKK